MGELLFGVNINQSFLTENNSEECLLKSNNTIQPELLFQQNSTLIIVYSALFLVAAIGNLTVFISLFRSRHRKSRISLMIRHLAIADLIVTFIMIPIEVGWRITGRWIAGNVACKVFLFLRALGPYLSSNVLVCVSLDRYFAVLHPLRVNDAHRRGKIMLAFAWGTSFVYCIPQSFVFRVKAHPDYPNYKQCVSFGFFTSTTQEIAYNLMCVMCMYFIPLFVIVVAYTAIICEISKNSKETNGGSVVNGRMRLRRSDMSNIERAKIRTLRMTITIVAVYIWCCTPYVIITMWYMFDRESAKSLPEWLQDTFFIMVVSNSCMNPIVYGSFAINKTSYNCLCHKRNKAQNNHFNHHGDSLVAAERGRSLAHGVIKCFLRFKKVGSGATKSTTMVHGMQISPIVPKGKFANKSGIVVRSSKLEVPMKMSATNSLDNSGKDDNQVNFHSEPCANICLFEDTPELSWHSTGHYNTTAL